MANRTTSPTPPRGTTQLHDGSGELAAQEAAATKGRLDIPRS